MQFYNPRQNFNATGGSPPLTNKSTGPNYQNGSTPNLGQRKVGYLDTEMLGSDQWGTGASFQGAARPAMIDALKGSFSNANPEDYAGMDEARNLFRQQLADVPTLENMGASTLDTRMQRGLSNLLSQHKSANAGSGRLGSRQFAGEAGDITSRLASEYSQGLINNRNAGVQQGLAINSGLANLQGRDLAERTFQNQQAQSLSGLLERMSGRDQQRESGLHQEQLAKEAADKAMWGQIISAGMMAGGAALGGPGGAMAGKTAGDAAFGGGANPSTVAGSSGYGGYQYRDAPSPIASTPYQGTNWQQLLNSPAYGGY
jgi:hypothetical protein